jgi:hypothetical protein
LVALVLAAIAHWPTARTTQLTYSRCDPQNISFRQPTGHPPDAEIAQKAHWAFQGPSLFAAAHESVVTSDCFRRFAAIIRSWLIPTFSGIPWQDNAGIKEDEA